MQALIEIWVYYHSSVLYNECFLKINYICQEKLFAKARTFFVYLTNIQNKAQDIWYMDKIVRFLFEDENKNLGLIGVVPPPFAP